jgi:hypothetical protein
MYSKIQLENLKEREHLKNKGTDKRIIIKWILERYVLDIQTRAYWKLWSW